MRDALGRELEVGSLVYKVTKTNGQSLHMVLKIKGNFVYLSYEISCYEWKRGNEFDFASQQGSRVDPYQTVVIDYSNVELEPNVFEFTDKNKTTDRPPINILVSPEVGTHIREKLLLLL